MVNIVLALRKSTNKERYMSGSKVYSPNQAALGTLLGGPLASVYFIYQNFLILDNEEGIKQTLIQGGICVLSFFTILLFLPEILSENFPFIVIPLSVIIITKNMIERFQFKKEDILVDKELTFQSNWRVFFMGAACFIMSMVLAIGLLTLGAFAKSILA